MKKSVMKQLMVLSLAGMILGLSSCQTIGIGTSRKKYRQEISRVQWSPDNKFLVFEYRNNKNSEPNDSYANQQSYTYTFDFISKQPFQRHTEGSCNLYFDNETQSIMIPYPKSISKNKYQLFEMTYEGNEKELKTPYFGGCGKLINSQLIYFWENVNKKNKLLKLNRSTQEITPIEPDESVQKFIQAEKIADYEIEHVFEKNGVLRLVLQATHQAEGLPTNQRPPVTYATALLQDHQITQIEKLFYLEKPFGVQMFFWGISPDNKLIFGKAEHLPPLEYFEYDYAKHQRNSRPDLNKINDYHVDGRVLTPEAFSPDFTQLVYLLAHSEDSEKNPIRDLMLIDLSTGKEESLFTVNTTLPQGDFTWSY
ncbi:MAG: hypothetical protein IV090_21570 [Candidatus Sericytochromatia bacterium]|nr:hypothetical protein [Candidatus Sericytochromatia bacterium]